MRDRVADLSVHRTESRPLKWFKAKALKDDGEGKADQAKGIAFTS